MLPGLRAIFFDLDYTLIDRDPAFDRWATKWIHRHPGSDMTLGQLRTLDARARTERAEFFAKVAELSRCDADEVGRDFFDVTPRFVALYPGVGKLLDHVRGRYRVAVVTNGSRHSQRTKLATVGLELTAFVSGEVGGDKPAPQIFQAALEWASCAASEALFVGDDPIRDMVGASNAGMHTCWISHGERWAGDANPPEWTIENVAELQELLR